MRLDDIRALLRAAPFRPFRIYLAIGETYDIHHPDMILATLDAVHIAAPSPGAPTEFGSVRIVSLVHIVKIEYLPPAAPVGSNGTVAWTHPDDPLDRLHRDLGLTRLNPLWAKLEILLGLFAVGCGVVGAAATGRIADLPVWVSLGPVLLITLGEYLALAGHRSHLYQSITASLLTWRTGSAPNSRPRRPHEHPRR